MDLDQIKNLCKNGEKNIVEYKSSTASIWAAFETICAFLNGKGGTVLIGVKDDGKISGQHVSDATKKDIATEIGKIEPTASIEVNYIDVENDKFVITIHVDAGEHAPYVYDGRAFQRDESKTNRMSQHRYEQLLVARGQLNHAWDDKSAIGYDIESLNHDEIRNTIRDGVNENRIPAEVLNYNIEDILQYLKLLKNEKITNAAVVLYAKDVEPNYSQCLLRMTRYMGKDKLSNFMDSKHVYGNAFTILSEANYFTMRHLPVTSFFESDKFKRIDKPTLPVLAVREALINAVSHRDYKDVSGSISFAIFDDRLEVWNNGILSPKLKIEDLRKQHESFPRNKRIAKIFYNRGWVEKAGIGTVRMIEECKKLGIPTPEFKEYSSGFSVTFKFKESINFTSQDTDKKILSTRQKKILTIIKQYKSVTPKQIIAKIENPPSDRMIRNDLNILKKYGFVDVKGAARNTVWILKE